MIFRSEHKTTSYLPLWKGNHLELDTSYVLDNYGAQQYQSLICKLQLPASLGRIGVTSSACTKVSSFHVEPRVFRT